MTDIYAALTGKACKKTDHKSNRKNCAGNPYCLVNMQMGAQGIWGSKVDAFIDRAVVYKTVVNEHKNKEGSQVLRNLQEVFAFMDCSRDNTFNLSKFTESMGLNRGEQQDPQEFNKLFLDKIDSLNMSRDGIKRLIEGSIEYRTTCSVCNFESCREESFLDLGLSIEGCSSVEDALQRYFRIEMMNAAENNGYDCARCGVKQDASRSIELRTAPDVLFLQLLRYIYDTTTLERKKVMRKITFPNTLTLRDEEYSLVAVLYHKGKSAYGGHYICEVLNWLTSEWWLCDDTNVRTTINPSTRTVPREEEKTEPAASENESDSSQPQKKRKKEAKKGSMDAFLATGAGADEDSAGSLDRTQNAYMFSYVKSSLLAAVPTDAPPHIQEAVAGLNSSFESQLAEYTIRREAFMNKIAERKEQFATVETLLSGADAEMGEHRLVPRLWLKSWVTGVSCLDEAAEPTAEVSDSEVVDLTEACDEISPFVVAQSTWFDSHPDPSPFLCAHGMGVRPSAIKHFKAIPEMAYEVILSTLPERQNEVRTLTLSNCKCPKCEEEYSNHFGTCERRLREYRGICKLIDKSGMEEDSHVLAKVWLTQLRKLIDSLGKEVEGGGTRFVEAFFEPKDSSGGSEKLDHRVNSSLCCPHSKLRKGYKRSSLVISALAWKAIADCFIDPIEFTVNDEICSECVFIDDKEDERKDFLRNQRMQQVDVNLTRLVANLKPNLKRPRPYYPVEFDNSRDMFNDFRKERFALIDSQWLRKWYDYISDITIPEPGRLTNESLRCEHNLSLIPPLFGGIVFGTSPAMTRSSSCMQEGILAELISEKQWDALVDAQKAPTESVGLDGNPVYRLDDDEDSAAAPFKIELAMSQSTRRWQWTPSPCEECISRILSEENSRLMSFEDSDINICLVKTMEEMQFFSQNATNVGSTSPVRTSRTRSAKKGRHFTVKACATDTAQIIKLRIYENCPVEAAPDCQRLYIKGQEMARGKSLKDYGVKQSDVVYLIIDEDGSQGASLTGVWESSGRAQETGFAGTFLSGAATQMSKVEEDKLRGLSEFSDLLSMGFEELEVLDALSLSKGAGIERAIELIEQRHSSV